MRRFGKQLVVFLIVLLASEGLYRNIQLHRRGN